MVHRRLNIGLITSGFHDDYSNSVCRGVSAAAEELDCNLFIFPCRFIDFKEESDSISLQNLSRHYNTAAGYASAKSLDLIIISTGAIFKDPQCNLVKEFFKSFGDVPIISLSTEVEGYPYVRCDGTDGMESIVRHLIRAHSCRRFAFVAGPKTHTDSNVRLETTRQILAENNIPFSEDNIVYTDFSEYCAQPVSRFLRSHSFSFDAICCANDATASAVYRVLQENGLKPGVDIIVTGYDNLSFASSCIPALTTVSADAADCAYRAVTAGVESLRKNAPIPSISIPTYPIFRESCCGSNSLTHNSDSAASTALKEMDDYISKWINQYASHDDPSMPRFINSYSRSFLRLLFNELDDPAVENISSDRLIQLFADFAASCLTDTMASNTLSDFLRLSYHVALQKSHNEHIKTQIHALFVTLYRTLNDTINTINYALTAETRNCMLFAHNISRHSISFDSDMTSVLTAIMEQLYDLGIARSYLYISQQPREIIDPDDIQPFSNLDLVAYHYGSSRKTLIDNPFNVRAHELISNSYTYSDKRATMFISPLFSAHEQYGVLVCEISYHYLSLFQTLIHQINSEIETTFLFSRLHSQLDKTTTENKLLSRMATRDSLTACYNRLGFFERAGSAVISPLNEGRHGFLIFSDLNHLKAINDHYGHDEGDYAICCVADTLRDCLGRSGIVSRIGGDEFVALMITDDPDYTCDSLKSKVQSMLRHLSDNSGKPYHITMSIGITDFICSEELVLQELIDTSDRLQYLDKQNKPDSINK